MDMITRMLTTFSIMDEDNLFYAVTMKVLEHIQEVPDLTISELADLCAVSPATISRFVKYMRCESYSHLKVEIARALPENRPGMPAVPEPLNIAPYRLELETAFGSVEQQLTPDLVRSCAAALCGAKRVAFLFNTLQLVRELQRELCLHGTVSVLLSGGGGSFLPQLQKDDVLIARVYDEWELERKSGSLRSAMEKGVKVLLLSAVAVEDGMADHVFSLGGEHFAVSMLQEQMFFDELLKAYRYLSAASASKPE